MRYFLDNGQIYRNIHDKHKAYLNTHCLDYRNTHGQAIEILMDHKNAHCLNKKGPAAHDRVRSMQK